MLRKTESDYRAMAKERGWEWVGRELPNDVLQKTTWKCRHGHAFEMRYANAQSGRECPKCTRRWRRRRDDYRRMGESHGLTLLSRQLPSNTREPAYWKLPTERGDQIVRLSYRSLAVRRRTVTELSDEELAGMLVAEHDAPEGLYHEGEEYGGEAR